tara:strand:+ start:1315 stop:1629 length:315 start_codon:yes stop_codon:yes gene_type:complete
MKRRKVKINKKAKREIDRYPLVEVHWYDIVSDSNWQSITACKKAKLPPCITKGHLLSQTKGITRIFGDYALSEKDEGTIDEIANTTLIPTSVIIEIKKIVDKRG